MVFTCRSKGVLSDVSDSYFESYIRVSTWSDALLLSVWGLSVCLYVSLCLSVCRQIHVTSSAVVTSTLLFVSLCLFVCLSISLCLSMSLSVCLSVCLCVCLCVCVCDSTRADPRSVISYNDLDAPAEADWALCCMSGYSSLYMSPWTLSVRLSSLLYVWIF